MSKERRQLTVVGKISLTLTSIVIDKKKDYTFECSECKRGFWRGLFTLWMCSKQKEINWTYYAILTYTTPYEVSQVPDKIKPYIGDLGITMKGNLATKSEYKKITQTLETECKDDE